MLLVLVFFLAGFGVPLLLYPSPQLGGGVHPPFLGGVAVLVGLAVVSLAGERGCRAARGWRGGASRLLAALAAQGPLLAGNLLVSITLLLGASMVKLGGGFGIRKEAGG